MTIKDSIENFKLEIESIASELKCDVSEVTRAQFLKHKDTTDFSKNHLQKLGGISNLKKIAHKDDQGLYTKYASKYISQYRNKLEKEYGEQLFVKDELLSQFSNYLTKKKFVYHKPVKFKDSTKLSRTLVACISDTHFGANIDSKEVYGVNSYNWLIASRRLAKFVK